MGEKLQRAIDLIMDGKHARARLLLMKVVRTEPNNEQAWVALPQCLTLDSQKRDCYKRILRINPNHEFARSEIERLGPPQASAAPAAALAIAGPSPRALQRACPYCDAPAEASALFCQRCGREIAP